MADARAPLLDADQGAELPAQGASTLQSQGSAVSNGPVPSFELAGHSWIYLRLLWIALPIAYVWSLPYLASIGYACKCEDYPHCSVSQFVSNAQGTGAMMAVFGWPLMHLWSVKHHLHLCGLAVTITFVGSFGALLATPTATCRDSGIVDSASPTTWVKVVHTIIAAVFCTSAVMLQFLLIRRCGRCTTWRCFFLAVVAMLAFAGQFLWLLLTHIIELRVPFVSWALVSTGLSAVSMFPWFYEKDVRLNIDKIERQSMSTPAEMANKCITILTVIGAILPVAYVWSLPILADIGFAHKCPGLPQCDDQLYDVSKKASVSSFIANPQATGVMAGTFAWPIFHMWRVKEYAEPFGFTLIIIFWATFGGFLAAPTTQFPKTHNAVVGVFCLCGLVFESILFHRCFKGTQAMCAILLVIGVASFIGVIITGNVEPMKTWVTVHSPWLFYYFEAAGLSAVAVFPWVYQVDPGWERYLQSLPCTCWQQPQRRSLSPSRGVACKESSDDSVQEHWH